MCNLLRYNERIEQAYAEWEFSEVRIEPKVALRVPPSAPAPDSAMPGKQNERDRIDCIPSKNFA